MPALPDGLRKLLATAIRDARRVAESGARKALEALAVPRPQFHDSMTVEEQALRRRLRAHGRQLGDVRDRNGAQEIGRLAHEVAYEHWHRMLFARFLAENHLLIEPDSGVAISMAECEELARDQGADPWALAARFAQCMLPRIFRPDDPALAVTLAPETRQALERLLAFLPAAVFTADDALGWTYQFWQAEKKDEVNASGVKIGADELPAVTQLFTERYMVLFLFHNTIGAWRAGKVLADRPDLAQAAASEAELREAVRLCAGGGYDFTYLRFVREPHEGDEEGKPSPPWRPAAGIFPDWPQRAAELRILDPCCGSGHFLVEGLELLVRLRMEEEGLGLEPTLRAVLAENLFGLEIDPRCTQIAAFNEALAAWKLVGRPIDLPPLHIACVGLAPNATKGEWLALTSGDERLRNGMEQLYEVFEQAPELGALIDPRGRPDESPTRDMFAADCLELQPLLARALGREQRNEDEGERTVAAHGMARAASLLAEQYTLVITNVPYLGRPDQSESLRQHCQRRYARSKADLATCFIERALASCGAGCSVGIVAPLSWHSQPRYRHLREHLLDSHSLDILGILGPRAFQTISGERVSVALAVISTVPPRAHHQVCGVEAGDQPGVIEKSNALQSQPVRWVEQARIRENPDARILLESSEALERLEKHASCIQGLATSDDPRFTCVFWEIPGIRGGWERLAGTVDKTQLFGGRERLLRWENGEGAYYEHAQALKVEGRLGGWKSGGEARGRDGVLVSQMSTIPVTLHSGDFFDHNAAVLIVDDDELLPAVWCLAASPAFGSEVRRLDKSLKPSNRVFVKVPFDAAYWRTVADERYPDGLPEPRSGDPNQWLFHGHPAEAEPATALQVAVGRLLGYRWPPEHDPDMRLATDARAWVARCQELDIFADEDGIVCLTALRGEAPAADRLRGLLAAAFGAKWSSVRERELLAAAGDGKTRESLEEWLRDHFFEEHCRLFHQRPFIWHVWDGRRDGFHALVSYHRLAGPNEEGRRILQALAYSYLGDWIERQKAEQREGREGADGRLAAALDLQAQLARILAGEPPCDIFVRWKPLHHQPIGWEPDINDGVRLNIRPFLSVELRAGGRKGAGILRWKPAIDWRRNRGKEPRNLRPKADFPWFWECPGDGQLDQRADFSGGHAFDGNRWNDLHYTNAAKRAARERAQGTGRG
ncbi:MAG TPA: SAM-dependent DNA methyltransferase [Candidatus Binatia bacterium]|nr:SAM-dependent DNA methyltransferase [Candidatus Binatia bacterium]